MTLPERRSDPVREFLNSVREAHFDRDRCLRKLQQTASQCVSLTAQVSGIPGGHGGDSHKDGAWAALADQRSQLEELYERAVRQEMEVESFISQLGQDVHRIILRLRYVDMLPWPAVQKRLEKNNIFYSDRQIYRIHGEALQEARSLWAQLHQEEGDHT